MSVTKEEIDAFTMVLYKKFGLDFTGYEPKSLSRRMNKVLHVLKFATIHELWNAILKDQKLLHRFMDEISVGLTSMFRDPMMWSRLRSMRDIIRNTADSAIFLDTIHR